VSGAGAAIDEIIAPEPTFGLQSSVTGLERPVRKSVQLLSGLKLTSALQRKQPAKSESGNPVSGQELTVGIKHHLTASS
jgi:hypothetical protein